MYCRQSSQGVVLKLSVTMVSATELRCVRHAFSCWPFFFWRGYYSSYLIVKVIDDTLPCVQMLPSDYLRVKPLSHSCLLYAYELPSTIACNPSMPRDQTTQCRCEENGDDDSGKPGGGLIVHLRSSFLCWYIVN